MPMIWTEFKSPEQIEEERREKATLIAEIARMTARVPRKVLAGSHTVVEQWKDVAIKGHRLVNSKVPGLQKLRDVAAALRSFE